ncbi:transcriptional regulator [Stygiomarasmius scandens]|uniref:Transcriptional regulator n=1 Tax=Marasmiellus scandens TaxID=2682957 RepID=A0ABR1JVI7_9AGAR
MNRQGQPQPRPPSLGPAVNGPAGLGNQYRSPYGGGGGGYPMPPSRGNLNPVGVLQSGGGLGGLGGGVGLGGNVGLGGGYGVGVGVPGLQPNPNAGVGQRGGQGGQGGPQTPFMQRGQGGQGQGGQGGGFPFGLQHSQQQQQAAVAAAQAQAQAQAQALLQQQQQQSNHHHLQQQPQTPNPGAPSVSSTSEVGLDPNDFPALGSTGGNSHSNGSGSGNGNGTNGGASYASQAGTGIGLGLASASGNGGAGATSQPRDFTPDDFPALGGSGTTANATTNAATTGDTSHPPGLNGFEQRQSLLGTLSTGPTPGMLNIGAAQARGAFDDKRNYQKLNPAWNASTSPNPGHSPSSTQQQQQNGTSTQQTHPTSSIQPPNSAPLNAPPGVPPPPHGLGGDNNATTPNHTTPPNAAGNPVPTPGGTGAAANSTPNPSLPSSTAHVHQHPQTPAQQILMSAADRWGLLGLLAMIKSAATTDIDGGLSSVGTDLGTMGLDMGYGGSLYSTFITPWADQSAAHSVEPDFHLPACYNVAPPPPGPSKAQAFSDETLFFMFYSSPRDALQEVAAQELWNRNWRFHKDLRLWITKESGSAPSQKVIGGESGTYTFWDPENWTKERKDMTVLYADLEEKTVAAFVQAPGLTPAGAAPGVGQNGHAQVGQGVGAVGGAVGGAGQRGSFQVGVAA